MKIPFAIVSTLISSVISVSAFATTINGNTELTVDGNIAYLSAYDNTSVIVNPTGDISHYNSYDNTHTKINGGEISFYHGRDQSTADVFGGDISWLHFYDQSAANIHYVRDLSWLLVEDNSKVTIYGSDFSYNTGHLSGTWQNGESFSFWALLNDNLTTGNINSILPTNIILHDLKAVPEPTTLALLVLGLTGIFLARRKNKDDLLTA